MNRVLLTLKIQRVRGWWLSLNLVILCIYPTITLSYSFYMSSAIFRSHSFT